MSVANVIDGLHVVSFGGANAYVLDAPDGLALIDTGFAASERPIADAVRSLGHSISDLRHIVLTHAHIDHIGALAALATASGATTYIHPLEAALAATGGPFRPMKPSPDLLGAILFRIFVKPGATVAPARIDRHVENGDVLPIAGGLRAIHVPGHCAGQLAYLWEGRGVLFAGDACMNLLGLRLPIGYEELEPMRQSLRALAALDFDIACFGHGKPIVGAAAEKFRRSWA